MHEKSEKIIKGLIPWSLVDFHEVNKKLHQILQTPKDDWPVSADTVKGIELYHPFNVVASYMLKKYPDKDIFSAHLLRYNNIIKFLREHEAALAKEGFLNKRGKQHFIKDEMLEILCTCPYTVHKISDRERDKYVFDFDSIVDQSWNLIKRNTNN